MIRSIIYERQDSKEWKGTAEVIGHDNHQVFGKQGGSYIHIHPSSLHLIQRPDKNITAGEESCVKTSKGCATGHDQNTMIDSNDDDLIDEESDEVDYSNEEGNSESLEDTQDDFEEIHKDKNQKIQSILNAENPYK